MPIFRWMNVPSETKVKQCLLNEWTKVKPREWTHEFMRRAAAAPMENIFTSCGENKGCNLLRIETIMTRFLLAILRIYKKINYGTESMFFKFSLLHRE